MIEILRRTHAHPTNKQTNSALTVSVQASFELTSIIMYTNCNRLNRICTIRFLFLVLKIVYVIILVACAWDMLYICNRPQTLSQCYQFGFDFERKNSNRLININEKHFGRTETKKFHCDRIITVSLTEPSFLSVPNNKRNEITIMLRWKRDGNRESNRER